MAGWKKRGWVRIEGGKKRPVKNVELWQELDALVARHSISYHHVRGHSGHIENERCDQMAVAASHQYE
jgi:ribonuclease HI